MLSDKEIKILKDNDYNVGLYLLQINATDKEGNKYVKYFENEIATLENQIDSFKTRLIEWTKASPKERENIVRKAFYEQDAEIQKEIDELQNELAGLSTALHQYTSKTKTVSRKHILEGQFMTNLLETTTDLNQRIEALTKSLNGKNFDLSKALTSYDMDLESNKEMATQLIKNLKELYKDITDRNTWLKETFELDKEAVKQIIC